MHVSPYALDIGKGVLTVVAVKVFDYLSSLSKTRTDRLTARETLIANANKALIESLQADVESLRKEIGDERSKRAAADQRLDEALEQVRVYRVALDGLSDKIDEQAKKIDQQAEWLAEQAERLAVQEKQISAASGDVRYWKKQAEAHKQENGKLQGRIHELESEVTTLKVRMRELEALTAPLDILKELNEKELTPKELTEKELTEKERGEESPTQGEPHETEL